MNRRGMMGQYAGFVSRTGGIIVDFAVIALILIFVNLLLALPMSMLFNLDPSVCLAGQLGAVPPEDRLLCLGANIAWYVFTLAAAPVYFIFFYLSTGQTIGMYMLGLRVVRLDGKPMSLWRSIVRWIGLMLSALPLGLGLLWVLFDDRRQGWMDKMAGTCVVYAWPAEQDEFMVDRFRGFVRRGRQAWASVTGKPKPVAAQPGKNYDLVSIAFPDYDKLDNVLGAIQHGIASDEFQILNATVLVKGDGDSVSVMGASDLSTGSTALIVPPEVLQMPEYELRTLLRDVPAQHFVVAVMLEEEYADALTRRVARVTATLIRRHDLGPALPVAGSRMMGTANGAAPMPAPAAAPAMPQPVAVRTQPAGNQPAYAATALVPAASAAPRSFSGGDEAATIASQAASLLGKLQQALADADTLRAALASRDATVRQLQAELDGVRATSVNRETHTKLQEEAAALEQVLARTMAERTVVQAELDSRTQELDVARQQVNLLQTTTVSAAEWQQSQRQVAETEQKLQRAQADNTATQTALDRRTAELSQLRTQLDTVQRQAERLQASLDKYEADATRTREQLATLQATTVSADELSRAQNQIDRLQRQLQQADAARIAVGERDAELAEVRADLNERNRQLAEARTIQEGLAAAVEGWSAVAQGQVPAIKGAAVQAAMRQGIPGRATQTLQDLADLVDVGATYEQRLYRAGIGTFWEVAHLADTDLAGCLGLGLPQTAVDFAAVRADALRLVAATGTAGLIYTGEIPDDFEPIAGIGKVYEQRLYDAGIRTYAALAAATSAQLEAICQARNPQPDYAGWVRQAQQLVGRSLSAAAAPTPLESANSARQVETLEQQLAAAQAEQTANQEELTALHRQVQAAQAERAAVQESLDGRTNEVESLRARLAAAEAAVARATSLDLERQPAFKLAAAKAAVDQGLRVQVTSLLQDLADLAQIGTVYEQQLYRAGIGTFWEVAHLADADLDAALQPDDLQRANLDYAALRVDARRLAEESATAGLIWSGEMPDDFEPIAGIGKVFEQRLYAAGVRTYAALAAATPEQLAAICQARKPLVPDYAGWIRQAQALSGRS